MSYFTKSQQTRSEKIILVTAQAVQRLKLFTIEFDGSYSKEVNHFIESVKNGVLPLVRSSSLPLSLNEFYFSPIEKKLFINVGGNPKTENIIVNYKFFFSNAPFNLPYDLDNGEVVEWLPIINSIGNIGQQLDDESTGIVLETSSSVSLINDDRFFDPIFDTLIWENQEINFYSWFPDIPINERALIFKGYIENKSFTGKAVVFNVKDFVAKLKNQLDMTVFSEDFDNPSVPSMIGKPKRRIYGQVENVRCISISAVNDGYPLTQEGVSSATLTAGSTTMTGSSAMFIDFLNSVSPGDEIFLFDNGIKYSYGVEDVVDAITVTLSKAPEITFLNKQVFCKPASPWQEKNRTWLVAGHKLAAPISKISIVKTPQSFKVDKTTDIFVGDVIIINNILTLVKNIYEDVITTATIIDPVPVVNDLIEKLTISKVFADSRELIYGRDYLYLNAGSARIVLKDTAEFNVANQRLVGSNLTFTNGSRILTTSASVDLRTILKSRDWIASNSPLRPTFYQILKVTEQTVTLRKPVAFSGGPYTEPAYYKSIDVIDEKTSLTANCLGYEKDGKWLKRPSDIVRHLVTQDAGLGDINEASFIDAASDCDYIMSLALPASIGGTPPIIRDVITMVNKSCFGSLYTDNNNQISFSILNSEKPEVSEIIDDSDVISFSVSTKQSIVNKVSMDYRPYVDVYSDQDATKKIEFTSTFVNEMVGIKNTMERTSYLFEDDKANIIVQRLAIFNSLSNTTVKIMTALNLVTKAVNDKIFLNFDRLYSRYGGGKRKLGIVSGISKTGLKTELIVIDMGNILNRVPSIAPNDATDFSLADEDAKMKWGFVLDNDTLTPDATSEELLGNNIIG